MQTFKCVILFTIKPDKHSNIILTECDCCKSISLLDRQEYHRECSILSDFTPKITCFYTFLCFFPFFYRSDDPKSSRIAKTTTLKQHSNDREEIKKIVPTTQE